MEDPDFLLLKVVALLNQDIDLLELRLSSLEHAGRLKNVDQIKNILESKRMDRKKYSKHLDQNMIVMKEVFCPRCDSKPILHFISSKKDYCLNCNRAVMIG